MRGRWKKGVCVVALLVLGACGEQQRDVPTGPVFAKGGGGSVTDCDFTPLHGFIVDYFAGSRQSAISALESSMESTSDLTVRRPIGYEIMDSIGARSRSASLSASALLAGENLTKGLIKCMFDASITTEFPGFPGAPLYDFHKALNAPAGGAYYVRPEAVASSSPAIGSLSGTTATGNLSGVAPPIGSTWGDVLDEKILIYGWPIVTDPVNPLNNSFEWALIRPNAIFDPGAVIALCVGDIVPLNTVLEESNIGFLSWEGSGGFICGTSRPLTMRESGWGPRAVARRLAGLITPQPAFATVLLSGGTGTAKTLKSEISFEPVDGAVTLSVSIEPKAVEKTNVEFTIQILATLDGKGANGICVTLTGFSNNGQIAQLLGDSNCDAPGPKQLARETETTFVNGTPKAGYATFLVTIPSPGAMSIAVTGDNEDNNLDLEIIGTSIAKFNVKP